MKKQLLTRSLLLVALFFSGSTLLAQTQVCGTVNLELYDSYGDGMCCTNGVGQALITDANGNVNIGQC